MNIAFIYFTSPISFFIYIKIVPYGTKVLTKFKTLFYDSNSVNTHCEYVSLNEQTTIAIQWRELLLHYNCLKSLSLSSLSFLHVLIHFRYDPSLINSIINTSNLYSMCLTTALSVLVLRK